jgi:hypothetical protein
MVKMIRMKLLNQLIDKWRKEATRYDRSPMVCSALRMCSNELLEVIIKSSLSDALDEEEEEGR